MIDLYVVDEGTQLDITETEAKWLVDASLIVKQEDTPNGYDTTGFIWDDLGLHGDEAILLIEWAIMLYRRTTEGEAE